MKAMKKALAILMVFSMVLSLGLVTAFAGSTPDPNPEHEYKNDDSVHVDTTPSTDPKYLKDVTGEEFKFKKYMVVPDGVLCPDVTFEFSVEPTNGMGYDLTNKTMRIYSSDPTVTADNPVPQVSALPKFTVSGNQKDTVTFSPTDVLYDDVRTLSGVELDIDVKRTAEDRVSTLDETTGVEWEKAYNEKYAVKEIVLDFSGVTFYEPGIYRYIIRELAEGAMTTAPDPTHADLGIMHDNHSFRILDVYVTDYDNVSKDASATPPTFWDEGTLQMGLTDTHSTVESSPHKFKITGYVLHKGAGTAGAWVEDGTVKMGVDYGSADVGDVNDNPSSQGKELDDKTDGFTNEYKPYDLIIAKQVKGNQASRDKYFKYTVTLGGLAKNGIYTVSLMKDSNDRTEDGYADKEPVQNAATHKDYTAEVMKGDDTNNYVGGNSIDEKATVPAVAATTTEPAKPAQFTGQEFVADADGTATLTFYLQHEQRIVLQGLPGTTTYEVKEEAEDYKPDPAAATLTRVTYAKGDYKNAVKTTGTETIAKVDAAFDRDGTALTATDTPDHKVYTSFLNTRDGVIPTGIISVIAPAVAVIVLGGAGLGFVVASKRREEEEEA